MKLLLSTFQEREIAFLKGKSLILKVFNIFDKKWQVSTCTNKFLEKYLLFFATSFEPTKIRSNFAASFG